MGLSLEPAESVWLPSLSAVRLPAGVEDAAIIEHLLEHHGIEVASGLGDLAGEIFRIGCMGHSARPAHVLILLAGLGDVLGRQDADVDADAGITTARRALPLGGSVPFTRRPRR